MNSAELGKYYPLNLLGPMGLNELAEGVKVQTYGDGDYIYRVWDESDDLLYVVDGKVQMLESGQSQQIIISHEDKAALRPFTHAASKIEAAIAKREVKILKVDFGLFSSLLARDSGKDIKAKIKKNTVSSVKSKVAKSPEIEPLELPDFDELDIELKPVKTTPPDFSRKKAVNRESAKAESTKNVTPKRVSRAMPEEDSQLHGEPEAARPVARPARFTRNTPKPAQKQAPEHSAKSSVTVKPQESAKPVAGEDTRESARVEVKPVANKEMKTEAKSVPKAEAKVEAKPEPRAEANTEAEQNIDKSPVEKFINRVKEELTEERRFDLKLVKSAEEPEKPKPEKLKVEKGLLDKLKEELTAERKFDLKLVKSADKPEPEPVPEPASQLSEIDQYLNAMVLYREEKWVEAHAAFLALTIDHPSTNLYMVYASKCSEIISDENLRTG